MLVTKTFKLTKEEAERFNEIQRKTGKTVAELVRQKILNEEDPVKRVEQKFDQLEDNIRNLLEFFFNTQHKKNIVEFAKVVKKIVDEV